MADIKVRVGQTDAIKIVASTDRSNQAFSVSGGTASVTQLDVVGQSNLENLNVTGIATFNPGVSPDIDGIIVDGANEKIKIGIGVTITNGTIFAKDLASFRLLSVSGLSTFNGLVDINSNLDISGNLNVDGQTDLDVLNVAETATFSSSAIFSSNIDANGNITITNVNPQINLIDSNNNDDFEIKNNDGVFTVRDATDGADRFTIASNGRATLANDVGVNGNLDTGGNLDVDGQTDLDVLNVAELATFSGIATFQSNAFVDGTLTAGLIDGGTF